MLIKKTSKIEKNGIVTSSILYNMGKEPNELLLVPDNKGELIVPLSDQISLKLIGNAKPLVLNAEKCYFFKPRRRGMVINCNADARFLIVKINPIYVGDICRHLTEVSSGVHYMDLSSQSLQWLKTVKKVRSNDVEDILRNESMITDSVASLNTTVAASIEQIEDSSGALRISDIYHALNVSKSKLEQHFNREIGLTPKEFCKIEKINYFI
ncbi:MAG: hypothetical protein ABJP45_12355, partial [Cyclobacteriaceae bacterium]